MHPMIKNKIAVIISFYGIAFLLFITVSCHRTEPDLSKYVQDGDLIFLNTAQDVKYVGSKNCEKCHREIYEAYLKSPTGRSMSIMDTSNVIEEFPQKEAVYDSSRNFYYEMIKRDNKFYQREFRLAPDGNVLYERWLEAQYVVGSGSNLRYYIYDENGKFYQLPLAWYVHRKRWDFAPGYKEFINMRFSRFLGPMCLSCHNGHMEALSNSADRYQKPYPIGIGCEACHGPGDLHSRQCEGEDIDLPSKNALTIVNPPKLSPQRRNDVCLQCHIEGVAWALHEGKSWFDFRPGMLLEEHHSVYARSTEGKNAFIVANSGLRMFKSRCYNGTHGNMACDLCHDSHGTLKIEKVMFNRQNCLRCHPIESVPKRASRFDESRENCIRCHMNQTGTDNTLHGVVNHDHWIRINADMDEINWHDERINADKLPLLKLIPVVDAKDNAQQVRLGIAYADMYWGEGHTRREYLDSARKYLSLGLKENKKHAMGNYYFGRVQAEFKHFDNAIKYLKYALDLRPSYVECYFWLGKFYEQQNDYDKAIVNLRQALELRSDDNTYLQALGEALYQTKQMEEAVAVLNRALENDNLNPYTYNTLGHIFLFEYNKPDTAVHYFEEVVNLDPDFPLGYINLGNVYTLLSEYDKAIDCYNREILTRPESAYAYYNIGRVFKLAGRIEESQRSYQKAIDLDPSLKSQINND
jgi:tetratricopeptide (TPR) repeat protein